ncbi:phospholipase A2 [Actinokineospora pegani]|uniref:phospholipase A2 n=1 Tax=Actinokineospora pegani TaxID=2654637 RepID=UPI0012EA462E|nr:phospholipase A2 [Actinokineospora pegani]
MARAVAAAVGDTVGRRVRSKLGWLVLVVLTAAGFAVVASRSAAPPDHVGEAVVDAAASVDALVDPWSGRDPMAMLPEDFTDVVGVVPSRMPAPDGTVRAVHTDGGCSTPWGDDDTRWDFSVVCRAHDLGYDLLRYAAAKGQPLPAGAREALDARLSADMHRQCEANPLGSGGTCRVVASLYSFGLVANSWHQRWGPPVAEPVGGWGMALLVVVVLLAVRVPAFARRRVPREHTRPLSAAEGDRAAYLGMARLVSLVGIVLAESALAFGPLVGVPVSDLWPLTWVLQLVPLFFFAGGNSNLLAWRAVRAGGAGYGEYLARRVSWLIRPVLALVTAWLVVPLSLDLLDAPDAAVGAFGRLVAQPLWLLGLYLLVVGLAPAALWLHERAPLSTPAALALGVAGLAVFGSGTVVAYLGGILLALFFGQLSFLYADGTLWRAPRRALAAVAVGALLALVALTTVGGHSPGLIAEPAETASFVPSAAAVLLLGLAQVALVVAPGPAAVAAVARGMAARWVRFARSAPMTVYLVYLCALLLVAGVVGAVRWGGQGGWALSPAALAALGLLAVPTALAFLLFERHRQAPGAPPPRRGAGRWDVVAATAGTAWGALGITGFALTGLTGTEHGPHVLGLPLDPMASVIHLLLGWYLLHTARIGTAGTPGPWLLAAVASVPPTLTTVSGEGAAVHLVTGAAALTAAAITAWPRLRRRRSSEATSPDRESVAG